jgi:antitoxin component YwqK of YwqJK toxin-antitoxin module
MAAPMLDGPYRDYWSTGGLACEGQYLDGLQQGEWRFYNRDGSLRERILFSRGREVPEWDRLLDRDVDAQ